MPAAGRVERGEPAEVGPRIVAVDLEQVDLVAGRVVSHVVGGDPLDADGEAEGDQRDDDPGPLATVEHEAADQPVQRDHGDQVGEDHLEHERTSWGS